MAWLDHVGAIVVLWLGIGASAANAASVPARLVPDCGGMFGLCGFRDPQAGGTLVIPQRFERAMPFAEGLAAVRIDGAYGYIDEVGKVVIEPSFVLAGRFYQGMAEVLVGDKAGVIDREGRMVVSPQFERSMVFTKDVLLVREGSWRNGYYSGWEQLDDLSSAPLLSGLWRLYHVRKGWIGTTRFALTRFENSGRGLIWASTGDRDGGPFGLLRSDGSWQVKPQFNLVEMLSDDRAIVTTGKGSSQLWGAVDQNGRIAIPLRHEWLGYFENGFGLTRKGKLQGLIDKAGRVLGGRYFDKVERMEAGDIARVMFDGKWHGIDRAGNIVGTQETGVVVASCPSGVRLLQKFNGIEVVDADARPTTPHLLDYAPYFRFSCNAPNAVRVGSAFDGKWSFLSPDGRLLRDDFPFDAVFEFTGQHAIVQVAGKWGVIDTSGRYTVEPTFDSLVPAGHARIGVNGNGVRVASEPEEGSNQGPLLLVAKKDGRDLTITPTGEERPALPVPDPRASYLACGSGARIFPQAGRDGSGTLWGLADKDGRVIIEAKYRALHCFRNGVAWAPIDRKQRWCPIGPDGTERDQPACLDMRYPYFQTHSYPERFADEPYENSVLWSRAFLEYGAGLRPEPPRMIGDGGNGGAFTIFR